MNGLHTFFRTLGAFIFLAALLAAPWRYGAVSTESLHGIVCAFIAAVFFALLTLWTKPRWTPNLLAQGTLAALGTLWIAAVLFAFVQIHPFSAETARWLSPHIGELADELLPAAKSDEARLEESFFSDADQVLAARHAGATLSVQTDLTRRAIPFLAVAAAAFLLAGILFPTERDRRVFWFFVVANGALMALAIFLFRTNADFGLMKRLWPAAGCPPYVNRNNAAGYLVLCLGPALGFLAAEIALSLSRLRDAQRLCYAGRLADRHQRRAARLFDALFEFQEALTKPVLYRFLIVSILITGACATLSRGGTLAALFSFFTAMALIVLMRESRKTALALAPALAIAFFLVCFGGLRETVRERMETLTDTETQKERFENDTRMVHWRAAVSTIQSYRWRGSGYGTYAMANRTNDEAIVTNNFFEHAENQTVETALVAGVPGLLFKGGFFLILCGLIRRRLASKRSNASIIMFGLGTASVLAGQAVAASFDFGLSLPANAILLAALCGGFAAMGPSFHAESDTSAFFRDKRKFPWGAFFLTTELLLLLAVFLWSERTLRVAALGDQTAEICRLGVSFDESDLLSIDSAIQTLDEALARSSENPKLHQCRAAAYILRCRRILFERFCAESPDVPKTILWLQTAPEALHQRIMLLRQSGLTVGPKKLREDPAIRENLVPAFRSALLARRLAPLDADVHTLCGLLLPLTSDFADTAAYVRRSAERAIFVSPLDPRIRFEAGTLLFLSGDEESACRRWRENLETSNRYQKETLAILTTTRSPKKLDERFEAALPDDFGFLEPLLHWYPKKTAPEVYAAILRKMSVSLQRRETDDSGQKHRDTAFLATLCGERADALAEYQRAIDAEPQRAAWRYEYGQLLIEDGELDAGIEALETAVLREPGNASYEKALKSARKKRTDRNLNPPELRELFKNSGQKNAPDADDRRMREIPMDSGAMF